MDFEQDSREGKVEQVEQKPSVLNSVTPLSKYLAMALFVTMPFIGGWIGYMYSPVKVVEVEKIVYQQISPSAQENFKTDQQQTSVASSNNTEDFGWGEEACRNWSNPLATPEEIFACKRAIALAASADDKQYRFSYYPETITLTGTYVKYLYDESDESYFYVLPHVHFETDFNGFDKLPKDRYSPMVMFRNYDVAEKSFGLSREGYIPVNGRFCTLTGSTTIEISEIIVDHFDGGIPSDYRLEAQLNQVIDMTGYTKDCKD